MKFRRLVPLLILGVAGCEPAPVVHRVEIKDLAFGPAELVISAGDSILWTNHDLFPHTSTVGSAAGWDTGPIPSDSSRITVALRAGTFNYVCQVHPTMHGTVIVR